MPRWEVIGIARNRRRMRGFINAATEQAALVAAAGKGIHVEGIRPVNDSPEAAALEALSSGSAPVQPDPTGAEAESAVGLAVVDAPVAPPPLAPVGLVGCPACGQPVSSMAPACPRCGHPMGGPPTIAYAPPRLSPAPPVQRVLLIEKTSKVWKTHMLCGACCAVLGTVMMCGGAAANPFTGLLLLGGLAWFIIARIGAWWNHG